MGARIGSKEWEEVSEHILRHRSAYSHRGKDLSNMGGLVVAEKRIYANKNCGSCPGSASWKFIGSLSQPLEGGEQSEIQ